MSRRRSLQELRYRTDESKQAIIILTANKPLAMCNAGEMRP